jgi:hypothetical protein
MFVSNQALVQSLPPARLDSCLVSFSINIWLLTEPTPMTDRLGFGMVAV